MMMNQTLLTILKPSLSVLQEQNIHLTVLTVMSLIACHKGKCYSYIACHRKLMENVGKKLPMLIKIH